MVRNRPKADVFNESCPSRVALDQIADKWTVLIVQALAEHEGECMRYGELQQTIGGISQKMLTQTLRKLETDGLVSRKVHAVIPPRVDYALTPLGRTLLEPIEALCAWAEKHMAEVRAFRSKNEGRNVVTFRP